MLPGRGGDRSGRRWCEIDDGDVGAFGMMPTSSSDIVQVALDRPDDRGVLRPDAC
jgi:hypothetical protein